MTDRAKVTETVQIGLEATPGTPVAAPHTVRAMSVSTKIGGASEFFRPDGHKFNALSALNMEWSTFAINGKPDYDGICYPLAMMFGNPAPSAVVGSVGGKRRVYGMADTALLSPKTATIMKGNSVRAQKIAYALLADLGLTFSRSKGIGLTGAGIGQLFTDGITMTASPTDIPIVPVVGKHLDCFIDPVAADLGTTKMLRAFAMEPSITGVFGPIWAIDSSQASFTAHVDLAPTTAVKLTLEADAAGMAYLEQYRADDLIFLRMSATGKEYEAGFNYGMTYDVCLGIQDVETDEDEDGVTIVTYNAQLIKDSTWGKALEIAVENDVASVA